jgi:hypothetical protein
MPVRPGVLTSSPPGLLFGVRFYSYSIKGNVIFALIVLILTHL